MVRHHSVVAWEQELDAVFERIDAALEDRYGDALPLHPARARRGTTARGKHDGLFHVGAAFSAGFGTEHGRGYVVNIRLATLANVSDTLRTKIEHDVLAMLREELPKAFPGRRLEVSRDGNRLKIHGDLSLGRV
jgi:hypothetical protein